MGQPRFVDRVVLHLRAGDGGHGCSSIHREKYKPLGGPDGGNGGHGGDIVLEVSPQVHTLLDFHFRPHLVATRGGNGAGSHRNGARGEDTVVPVPPGTVVLSEDGQVLADLVQPGTRFVAAAGGRGGLGNAALASKARKAPGFALKGEPGEEKNLLLELKTMADVGLVGFPSAGKSSLVSVCSAAKPKIADYPFTTLQPNLGVVTAGDVTFTIADVPGLIPGAHEGKGLGHDFLRHIERTAVLAHVVDCAAVESSRDPISDIEALEHELAAYEAMRSDELGLGKLRDRPRVIVLNKIDLPDGKDMASFIHEECRQRFGWPVVEVSAVTRQGLHNLLYTLAELVKTHRKQLTQTPAEPPRLTPKLLRRKSATGGEGIDFTVEQDPQDPQAYIVRGTRPERWIVQTDFDNDEAVGYLGDRLARLGVEDALVRAGALAGCTVTIGPVSFTWEPTTLAGGPTQLAGRGDDPRLSSSSRATAAERKRTSQLRRGLIDEYDFGEENPTTFERWEG